MFVPTAHPLIPADAIYIPAVGIYKNGGRLIDAGGECMRVASQQYLGRLAPLLILSNAYRDLWKEEWRLKLDLTDRLKIPREAIIPLSPDPNQRFTTSQSETDWLGAVIQERKLKNIIVVNEEWHLMRTIRMLKKTYPDVTFQPISVHANRLETHKAFPPIKGYVTYEGLWPIENILLSLMMRV